MGARLPLLESLLEGELPNGEGHSPATIHGLSEFQVERGH